FAAPGALVERHEQLLAAAAQGERQLAAQRFFQARARQVPVFAAAAAGQKRPRQPVQLGARQRPAARRGGERIRGGLRKIACQGGQREDVEPVVLDDAGQRFGVACLQERK